MKKEDIKVLISQEELQKRIKEMGKEISEDYKGKEIVVISVLRGAVFFTVELTLNIDVDMRFDFIQVSSYNNGTESTGKVQLLKDIGEKIEGKHVLIIEDIIDTGLTLKWLKEYIASKNPASLKLAVLVSKPERREIEVEVDYLGFEIPNKYVVGFGFDVDNVHRNLPYVGTID